MSVCVAVTDSPEGQAALAAAALEATQLHTSLVAVNLTAAELHTPTTSPELAFEVVVPPSPSALDEVEQVLQLIESRSDITRLVVGVRQRSAVGKALRAASPNA